jgi:hypothetical protein
MATEASTSFYWYRAAIGRGARYHWQNRILRIKPAGTGDQPMATDHIRYDILAQDALRGMVRTVLEDIARSGLPGDHHFFITFDTGGEGVKVSQRMRAQYPQDMTIVLQHQFWDLIVTEERFEVGLSFGGIPERLIVPFAAITTFADPSVQFALQFQDVNAEGADAKAPETGEPAPKSGTKGRPPAKQKKVRPVPALAATPEAANPPPPAAATAEVTEGTPDKPGSGAQVVRLDRFRKK